MTNCEKIRNAVKPYVGQSLASGKIVSLVLSLYPGTNPTSIIPSDHSGANPVSGRSYCSCSGTGKQIFSRSGSGYLVRGLSVEAVLPLSPPTSRDKLPIGNGLTLSLSADDLNVLVKSLNTIKTSIRPSNDRAWHRKAALRVIDCVLSLNRRYDSFVVPRLDGFERTHSAVHTVAQLKDLIASYPSPSLFSTRCLDYNDDSRSATLATVVEWLAGIAGVGDYDEQMSNLERWAKEAKPEEHSKLGIGGFGLGGFQYLRMLFGANTTKPDIHIQRYVASCVGHRVSDTQALALLEAAARQAGISLRDLDTTVWEQSAR
jgi:hypothetical protein